MSPGPPAPDDRVVRRRYRPFGAVVDVTMRASANHCDAIVQAFSPAVARFRRDAGAVGRYALSIHVDSVASGGSGRSAWPTTELVQRPGGIRLSCGDSWLEVDHPAGVAQMHLSAAVADEGDAVRCFVEGAVSSLLIGGGDVVALHAAFVQFGSRAVLLRGMSGAGKSTLAYAAMRAGARLISDDWSYAVPGGPSRHIHGYPWRMWLMPDAAERFPESRGIRPVAHPSPDRWKVPIEPSPGRRQRAAVPAAVVFIAPGRRLSIDPIDSIEALGLWRASALPSERDSVADSWLRELLDRPCAVLQRGTDPDDAARALQRLATTW